MSAEIKLVQCRFYEGIGSCTRKMRYKELAELIRSGKKPMPSRVRKSKDEYLAWLDEQSNRVPQGAEEIVGASVCWCLVSGYIGPACRDAEAESA